MTVIGEAYIMIKGVSEGDTKGLDKIEQQVSGVGGAAEKSTGKARAAFRAMGGALSSAFGPAFAPIEEFTSKFEGLSLSSGKFKENVGKNMLAAGGAVTAAGTLLTTVSDKDKIATKQLQGAVTNAGGSWTKYKEETEKTVKSQEKFGHNAVDTQDALKGLVTKTGDVEGSYKNMGLVSDIAASKNISMSAASKLVGQAMTGNTRVLKQFGISQDDINKKIDTGAIHTKNLQMAQALAAAESNKNSLATLKLRDAHLHEELATTKDKGAQEAIRKELAADAQKRGDLTNAMGKNKDRAKELKDQIKELSTGTVKGSAAVDLIGAKMKGQAAIAADTFSGKMKAVKARVEDFVGEVGQKVGPALQIAGPAMMGFGAVIESGVIGKIGKGLKAIKDFMSMEKLAGVATKVWTGIQAAFNIIMDANPIMLIVIAIAALIAIIVIAYIKFKPFRDLVNAIGKDIKNIFVTALDFVIRAFHDFINVFEAVWKTLVRIIKNYWPIILAVLLPFIGIPIIIARSWNKIIAFFRGLWNTVYNTIKNFISKILDGIHSLWEKGSGLVRSFINSVVTTITGLPGKAAAALAQLGTKVAAKFSGMATTAKNTVTNFVSSVVTSIGSIVSKSVSALANFGTSIKNKITSAVSGAGSWLVQTGKNMAQGFINGITSMFGSIASAAGSMISHLGSSVAHALHLGSPSKLAAEWGAQTGAGFIMGLEGTRKDIENSANTLVVPMGANAAGAGGAGRVINLFPNATIDFGQNDPAQIIQSIENAIIASRL
jgi:phage-related protein